MAELGTVEEEINECGNYQQSRQDLLPRIETSQSPQNLWIWQPRHLHSKIITRHYNLHRTYSQETRDHHHQYLSQHTASTPQKKPIYSTHSKHENITRTTQSQTRDSLPGLHHQKIHTAQDSKHHNNHKVYSQERRQHIHHQHQKMPTARCNHLHNAHEVNFKETRHHQPHNITTTYPLLKPPPPPPTQPEPAPPQHTSVTENLSKV